MESRKQDLELRVRMNLLKCERFKTFHEELPTKKFLFLNESDSFHGIKLISDDASSLNKASEAYEKLQLVVSKDEEKPEEVEEIIKPPTALFRDEIRRIDIVLVVEDDVSSNTDSLKIDFITTLLRTGLEIEIEPGVMPIHKHLLFIKIHAPDSILNEYGNIFGVKRYFANNRVDFIGPKTFLGKMWNIYRKRHEKEWLQIIRKNYTTPNGYSNYERSLIVYKIMQHLPFGDPVNYYGIHRLLKRNVILDAYALHDGPYFFIPKQTTAFANGRQILYYHWVGLQNMFQSQPLHVIHEYFGPKIAFYYAFYGFYNVALMVASIASIITTAMPFIDKKEHKIRQLICKSTKIMCPECIFWSRRCPKRQLKEYCTPMAINLLLDHPYVLYFSTFMVLWAFAFLALWRRKEYILNWLWEVGGYNSYYTTASRPEFKIDFKNPRKSSRTGFKYNESAIYKIIRLSFSKAPIFLYVALFLRILTESEIQYDAFADLFVTKKQQSKIKDYTVLAMFQTIYTFLFSAIEMVFNFFCYKLVDLENHESFKAYEKSLIIKQFGFSITTMYPYMCYVGWMTGRRLYFLSRCARVSAEPMSTAIEIVKKWIKIPPWGKKHCWLYCWPFTCINEMSILLIVMLFWKQVVFRIAFNVFRLNTDYNEASKINAKIPCWEREYKLKVFNETMLTRQYMVLAVQFTLITFFVTIFPLAPLIVLIVNVWDIRHSARKLLLASRRPLLVRSPGIGEWNNVFLFAAYTSVVTNALTLALTTRLIIRYYFKVKNMSIDNILDFSLSYLRTRNMFVPEINCYAPNLLRPTKDATGWAYYFLGLKDSLMAKLETYWFADYQYNFFSLFVVVMVSTAFIIQYLFKPHRRDIEATRTIENGIKTLYSHYAATEKKKGK